MATPVAVTIRPSARAQKKLTAVFELSKGIVARQHPGWDATHPAILQSTTVYYTRNDDNAGAA
eukprot:COSAG03_NODE_2310_length_2895_cov_2.896638_2_plen_63_part_00